MVTRKPFGPPLTTTTPSPNSKNGNSPNPPYPTTPTSGQSPILTQLDRAKTIHSAKSVYSPDLNKSPAFDLIDMNEARQRPHPQRKDSDVSSHGTWDSEEGEGEGKGDERDGTPGEDRAAAEVPKPLRISKSQQDIQQQQQGGEKGEELPSILKPGPVGGGQARARKSMEGLAYEDEAQGNPWAASSSAQAGSSAQASSNNPYRQQNAYSPETCQSPWRDSEPAAPPQQPIAAPPPPAAAPPAPPVELSTVPQTPADELSQMSLGERQHERRPEPRPFETAEILAVPQQGRPPLASVVQPNQQDMQDGLSTNPWRTPSQELQRQQARYVPQAPLPPNATPASHEQQYAPPPGPPPKGAASTSLIDHEDPPSRSAAEPLRPAPISTAQSSHTTDTVPETPITKSRRQRSEHYQIKHINWHDASHNGLRRSPILTQNANGPCPLLALVNALVLTTPQNLDTALVETLRTREQVSLGLLLDAVFDELMSGRRGDTANALPDVGELYAFLLALHTGMNVNPRFITPASAPRGSLDGVPADKASLHPIERAQTKAGCFEETKEMRLYSTFNVPLLHGWTAPKDTPAYTAFERNAPTFEDAQNIQFLESELEDKLRSEGLGAQEQQVLQDIQIIKSFLTTWPTQLTDYGLETISASLRPGQFAILFRNDHFSTIYKEPRHGALMTLVTDAGYGSHDEIVWESLVDVGGAASEMFSGDFRVVSHGQGQGEGRLNQGSSGGGEEGWTTVQGRGDRRSLNGPPRAQNGGGAAAEVAPPLPGPRPAAGAAHSDTAAATGTPANGDADLGVPNNQHARTASEQEDHDLALALQLQEEEEDQQRQAEQRRRREQELSERFLSTESTEGPRPPIPPRRSGGSRASNVPVSVSGGTNNNNNTSTNSSINGNRVSAAPSGRAPVNRAGAATAGDPEAPPTYEQSASDRPYRPAGSTAAAGTQHGNPLNAYDALRRQHTQGGANVNNNSNGGGGGGGVGGAGVGGMGSGQGNRRQSQAGPGGNRVRRRSSQLGAGGQMPGAFGTVSPGGGMGRGSGAGPGAGVGQAAGIRDAEDKCCVM